jgi:hypothetical protein
MRLGERRHPWTAPIATPEALGWTRQEGRHDAIAAIDIASAIEAGRESPEWGPMGARDQIRQRPYGC